MSVRTLAIETATDACSVALAVDGRVVATASLLMPRRHAEELVPLIQSMVQHAGWSLADLAYVAVSAGPGSYTGLRIGVSTAKGLCYATGSALVAAPTLEALARRVEPFAAPGDVIVAAFDARRSMIYGAAFVVEDERRLRCLAGPEADDAAAFAALLPQNGGTTWMVGDGSAKLAAEVSDDGVRCLDIAPSASTVAVVGHERWLRGATEDLASFEPQYLREFVAKKPAGSAFEKLPF